MRPIAIGDPLRRLVGKTLLATGTAKAQVDALRPVQVGVGVPNAAESVAMGTQALANCLATGQEWACLQVDWSNAFNTIDRTVLLSAAASRVPAVYNYLRYAYAAPAPLFVGDVVLQSQRGTHQGCPLGPLGFALGLQELVERIHREAGLLWGVWYLDDGVLVGDPARIQQVLSFLDTEGSKIGLQLNRKKCVLWGPAALRVPEHASLQVRSWAHGAGITVLGVPVDRPGHTTQLESDWDDVGGRLDRLLEIVSRFPNAQVAHHLLTACGDGCRVNHLLRATNSYSVQRRVLDCHESILSCFMDLSGIALSPTQRLQCVLPVRVGGCGVKGPAQMQPAARIAALAGFYSGGARRVGVPTYATSADDALIIPVLADLSSRLGPNQDPLQSWMAHPAGLETASRDHCSQHWWSGVLGAKLMTDLLDHSGPRDQARLLEQRSGLGSTWMTATPSPASGAVFSSEHYCLGLKWWLGAPLFEQTNARCPGCGQTADREGDHFLCCPRINFAKRHDAVQDTLFTIVSSAGLSVAKEVVLPSSTDAHLRPADLLLNNWHAGQPTAVDVTISHGWSAGTSSSFAPPRDNWRPHLRRKERLKHDKYDEPCAREGWHFLTAAFGTWGGLGPEGAKTVSRIVKRASTWADADARGYVERRHYEALGVALFRQIWTLLEAKNRIA